jgi:tetratricopeptide (TPR) repeat protein
MTIKLALTAGLLAALTMLSQAGLAQENLVAPRPITAPQPDPPTNAAGEPVDGWITLRYSVMADGTSSGVRVINVMPPDIDPASTLSEFARWTFLPGTRNGTAIDWHNNETIVAFRAPGGLSPTADAFAENYAAIASLLADEKYDAALEASNALIEQHATRLTEIGLALAQRALIYMGLGDAYDALGPAQMATDRRVPMLSGIELSPALQLRLQIEAALSHTYEALHTYRRLANGVTADAGNAFARVGERLTSDWEGKDALEVKGRIDDGVWRFDLHRPFFYIINIDGNLTTLDLECDTTRLSLQFDPEADYGLRESFGDCTLFAHGNNGTTFSLVEVLPPAN